MVNMLTPVEVYQGQQSNLRGRVITGFWGGRLLAGIIVRIDVGLIVLGVVQLHDLARDGGLQSSIVV